MTEFILKSNSFKNGGILPDEQVLNCHGCSGLNISPELHWENSPEGTKSFALIVHDPDAPIAGGWYHWIVLNIPKEVSSFKKGEKIQAPMIETVTSFDDAGYGGACPPIGHGVHHYNFRIYALDTFFDDKVSKLSPNEVEELVKEHLIEEALLTAIYQR